MATSFLVLAFVLLLKCQESISQEDAVNSFIQKKMWEYSDWIKERDPSPPMSKNISISEAGPVSILRSELSNITVAGHSAPNLVTDGAVNLIFLQLHFNLYFQSTLSFSGMHRTDGILSTPIVNYRQGRWSVNVSAALGRNAVVYLTFDNNSSNLVVTGTELKIFWLPSHADVYFEKITDGMWSCGLGDVGLACESLYRGFRNFYSYMLPGECCDPIRESFEEYWTNVVKTFTWEELIGGNENSKN